MVNTFCNQTYGAHSRPLLDTAHIAFRFKFFLKLLFALKHISQCYFPVIRGIKTYRSKQFVCNLILHHLICFTKGIHIVATFVRLRALLSIINDIHEHNHIKDQFKIHTFSQVQCQWSICIYQDQMLAYIYILAKQSKGKPSFIVTLNCLQ